MEEKIESIYAELQGVFLTLPEKDLIYEDHVWNDFNNTIDRLNGATKKDYSRFKIQPRSFRSGDSAYLVISTHSLRMKLGSLINTLHAEFFNDKVGLFENVSNTSGTFITQNVSQTNIVHILFDFNDLVESRLRKYETESKEKNFLEKIKSSLKTVSSVNELMVLIFKLGTELGLTAQQIYDVFK